MSLPAPGGLVMQISDDEMKKLMFRFDDLEREVRRVERNALNFWRIVWAVMTAVILMWIFAWALGMLASIH